MRFAQFRLLFCLLILSVSVWAQQPTPSQQATATQPGSDPQAVATVQAAITALGGATATSQAQSWTFQAQMQGPHANGTVSYVISTDADTGKVMRADGTMKSAPLIHSHFVPALVGAILLKESQDPEFSMQFLGTSTIDSKPVTLLAILIRRLGVAAQIWAFDSANLPVQVEFRLSAEIGARQSVNGLVGLSDYRLISGVFYPFQIVSFLPGRPPEMVTIQSVSASATAPQNEYNGLAGDI